eukprot:SAG22_NODE_1457_length_4381_cov_6.147828_1_plen_52_part_10
MQANNGGELEKKVGEAIAVSCVTVGSFQASLKRAGRYCARRPPIPSTESEYH